MTEIRTNGDIPFQSSGESATHSSQRFTSHQIGLSDQSVLDSVAWGGQAESNIDLRIVVVTDGHYNQAQSYADNHDTALNIINSIHNERQIDLVVHNGDIVNNSVSTHQTVIDEFFSQLPCDYEPVRGNHDWATESEWNGFYGHDFQHSFELGDYGIIITDTGGEYQNAGDFGAADAVYVENQIDQFGNKDGVFVFQHIAPFTNTDAFGVESPNVRTQYARDEVKFVSLGHYHSKLLTEMNDGGRYIYASRLGGVDTPDSRSIADNGIRVFDVR